MLRFPDRILNKMPKYTDIQKTKNVTETEKKIIMGHRSVITTSIFILGITLCDFHL